MRLVAALITLAALAAPAHADDRIEIFDAHLHYNFEPKPTYQPDEVLALLKKHRVTGILSTSRPNTGTHVLMARHVADSVPGAGRRNLWRLA